jgi:dihydroflavonol-4-reductase
VRIFLTGATGYIGGALSRRLVADGHEVRALVRDAARAPSRAEPLEAAGVACFEGDITERVSMREAMSGADWVVHTAAELDFRRSFERMRRVNVEGSESVASLAFKLGVGRMLALSSMAVFGGSPPDGSAATETSLPILPLPGAYGRTKAEADAAMDGWAKRGLRLNRVYPSLVYGAPAKKTGTNSLLRAVALGRMPVLVGGDRLTSWVHLDDLVEGLVRVIERAPVGESYLMSGEAATVGEVLGRVCELANVRPPRFRVSPRVAYALLRLAGPALRGMGVRGLPDAAQARSLARHWHFSDAKARHDLDWHPRGLDEGLPPTIEHLLTL